MSSCDSFSNSRRSSRTFFSEHKILNGLFHDVITPSDRNILRQYFTDAENALKDYQAEINRHKAAIMLLGEKQKYLKESVEKYRSLLSPIRWMPSEILMTIFKNFNELNDDGVMDFCPSWTLSRVCSRWRKLLFSQSHLWSSLAITSEQWEGDFPKLLESTKLFVQRSNGAGAFGLTLTTPPKAGSDVELAGLDPVLEVLVPTSFQWKALHLAGCSDFIVQPVFRAIRNRLPILEHLSLITSGGTRVENPLDIFEVCPSLRSLQISQYNSRLPPSKLALPWHQIQTLHLFATNVLRAFEILSLCRNVQKLQLRWVTDHPQSGDRSITTDKVEHLSITSGSLVTVEAAFSLLTLSRLSSLEILGFLPTELVTSVPWLFDEQPVIRFLRRSSCPITSLCLQRLPILDTQVISILQLMPALTDLHIEELNHGESRTNRIITTTFLEHLRLRGGSSDFLRHLAKLKLVVYGDDSLDQSALVSAITSRQRFDNDEDDEDAVEPLKSVTITIIGDEDSAELLSSLRSFEDMGLKLKLSYKQPK